MEVVHVSSEHVTRTARKKKTKYQKIIADAVGAALIALMILVVIATIGYRVFHALSV